MLKFYISLILMMTTAAIASDDNQELNVVKNFAIPLEMLEGSINFLKNNRYRRREAS